MLFGCTDCGRPDGGKQSLFQNRRMPMPADYHHLAGFETHIPRDSVPVIRTTAGAGSHPCAGDSGGCTSSWSASFPGLPPRLRRRLERAPFLVGRGQAVRQRPVKADPVRSCQVVADGVVGNTADPSDLPLPKPCRLSRRTSLILRTETLLLGMGTSSGKG